MKIILNKTKIASERYTLMSGSMGNYGEPNNHANNHFEVCNGIDRGNGYQGYSSVSYFLKEMSYAPQEAKDKLKAILKEKHLSY